MDFIWDCCEDITKPILCTLTFMYYSNPHTLCLKALESVLNFTFLYCDIAQNLFFPHFGYHDFNLIPALKGVLFSMNSRYSVTSIMGLLWSSVVMHFNLKGGIWPHAVESLSLYNTCIIVKV